ncbi:MAG: hypothetical protein HYT38_00110 [Candidatus Sungbacteria bacterium]|uniref:Uncharacterized protein n=1 Tax=Candidatus Sungiibacteriota bacterium TaxID=2750080 RepID=A0A9D6HTM0_9BACT|nr:hypothetical protein [Candidatus Sungbacteria bacterium]
MTCEACYTAYETTCDTDIKVLALAAMMDKASTQAELETVRNLANPCNLGRTQVKDRLRLERLKNPWSVSH